VPQLPASHFLYMVVYALLVSLVFATLLKDELRERLRTVATLFAGFIAAALAIGWLMYPFPL